VRAPAVVVSPTAWLQALALAAFNLVVVQAASNLATSPRPNLDLAHNRSLLVASHWEELGALVLVDLLLEAALSLARAHSAVLWAMTLIPTATYS